ncbi:DNA polymerase/3'-5' exonuclease PolX [Saliterribacillus persicus]|uniref:DNA polymerase beta n=1 Tax=Saliterribacillus persicus TaxID=930114 RepID=A0A368XEE5_9BACI|nr:DNA polymerase/3'-5' exonuclease PolX [Saliterribacillus persicus]RCW66351.1 DNA polymerase (family 10) [Saliterribacillus persicus]
MAVNKKDVIKLLEKIAIYLELKAENPFKISAYRKAAQALETDQRSLAEIDDFTKIKGVGKGTATVITQFIETESSETLEELQKEVPEGLIPLLDLPGLGGKKLAKLYQELNITNEQELKEACEQGKVEELSGFGKKTAEKILQTLKDVNNRPDRLPLPLVVPVVKKIESYLAKSNDIEKFQVAGSFRRLRETVKDLDFIIATNSPKKVREYLLELDNITEVVSNGDTKVSIILKEKYPLGVDFRLVKVDEFYTTLHHFTGSKDHNVRLRQLAKEQEKKISEYGVEDLNTGKVETFTSEQAFFESFGLNYIPPEIREDDSEIEKAKDEISLIDRSMIRGDLHMHSTWSDGAESIETMVQNAIEYEYEYIVITDHSKFLRVANGLNEERIKKQREEIDQLNEKYKDIHIFAGIEMDILPDGSLDFDDDVLKQLDFVIASIHSSFNKNQAEIHHRLETALKNPYVDMIAHPTGRLLGKREGYNVDVEWLIDKAQKYNKILELNANPNRLDLASTWVRKAQEKGVRLAINTDAHNLEMLKDMDIGVKAGRRGWLKPENVINTWEITKLQKYIEKNKRN